MRLNLKLQSSLKFSRFLLVQLFFNLLTITGLSTWWRKLPFNSSSIVSKIILHKSNTATWFCYWFRSSIINTLIYFWSWWFCSLIWWGFGSLWDLSIFLVTSNMTLDLSSNLTTSENLFKYEMKNIFILLILKFIPFQMKKG